MSQVHVWPGLVLYLGPTYDPRAHRHYALQSVVALDGELAVEVPPAESFRCGAVRIPSQALHRVVCDGPVVMLLAESDGVVGPRLEQASPGVIPEALLRACRALALRPTARGVTEIRDGLLSAFALSLRRTATDRDPRIGQLLRRIGALDEPDLAEVAAGVGLSTERCRHVFRESMGLPFSRYKLWRRVLEGAQQCMEGASGTTSALASGFADSAHFSRTFRRTFGLAPSTVFRSGTQFFVHERLLPPPGGLAGESDRVARP
jgi:AraC family transcriptional regulator